ncbi:phosphatidic acid phosphatase type 2/haloperoxidase [Flagelloscypha sp. PMI_526]|nr:phosphatidic acid phosphatase type 2/haloperoxidase [Flagelloscypha sp. PMI_526]
MSRRPHQPFSLAIWLRLYGEDIITMAAMGAIGLGVYKAKPAPTRSFPLYFSDGEIVYPDFAYPLRKEIVPIYPAALIAFLVPFFFICVFQIRRKSVHDLLTSTMGVLKSLITAAVFQVFLKWLIGGLRPHFYAVCQPKVSPSAVSGVGFGSLMYDRSVYDSLESFPSGHSTAGWAGLLYLSLYLNAQFKIMAAHNPSYWKMVLVFAPLLGATLISGALTIDEFHNWYDVLAGGIIGSCCALVAYRSTFAAILDFRFNHLLLPRTTSLFLRNPVTSASRDPPFFSYTLPHEWSPEDLPFTRAGGWGYGEGAFVGAPGDATAGMGSGKGALNIAERGESRAVRNGT